MLNHVGAIEAFDRAIAVDPGFALAHAAKAHALLDGRVHVSTDDIRYVARPVLRHRLGTSFRADSDGVKADHIVEKLFATIREPMER